jgi:uncharacterized membrane protein YfcA
MNLTTSADAFPVIGLLILGLCTGYISGLVGIGGGMILVPALVYFFGLSQHQAQGTTLALMLPPIGLLATWQYYKKGSVDIHMAVVIIIGFVLGNYLGGKLAINVSNQAVRKIFAVLMMVVAIKMLFFNSKPG